MQPTHAKAVKQQASETALSHLVSAQSQVEQARSRYQTLRALLPSTLMEAVRLTQGEQRAAVAGQQGRDAAQGLITQAERALQQLTAALRGDHEAMATLTRQLDGEALAIHPRTATPMESCAVAEPHEDARRVAAELHAAIADEVAQAVERHLAPLRAQLEPLLVQLRAAQSIPDSR